MTPGGAKLRVLGAAVLFSTGAAAIKAVSFSGWQVACLRSGVAALALFLLLPETRRRPNGKMLGIGLIYAFTGAIPWSHIPAVAQLGILSFTSATLSALMSNTATATMLIPLANTLHVAPSTAVLIALAASVGIPFIISTPPNAMVFGEGGLKSRDLLVVGMLIMLLGCLLITLTGPWVLNLLGI